jgi:hypothetical protein
MHFPLEKKKNEKHLSQFEHPCPSSLGTHGSKGGKNERNRLQGQNKKKTPDHLHFIIVREKRPYQCIQH